jgi:hypothetical protein
LEIPADIRLRATIAQGSVYYFVHESTSFKSSEPHYFIVLNHNPATEQVIYLVCASSQIEKAKARIQFQRSPISTLVFVSPEHYAHFSKETVINCNSVFEYDLQTLTHKLEHQQLKICEPLTEPIVTALIAGLLDSPLISRKVKRLFKNG